MTDIPAHLKPEVGRFIHRANQLRQVKPAIAYYCAILPVLVAKHELSVADMMAGAQGLHANSRL